MRGTFDVDDVILNFDPAAPQHRFRAAGLHAAHAAAEAALPLSIPWPAGTAPTTAPLATPPAETDDLSRFNGYDAVVITWTSAEASAMATLFTPGYPISAWYEYRNDIAQYIQLVTGSNAPFNSREADMARYYHSLGLYFPCTIRGTSPSPAAVNTVTPARSKCVYTSGSSACSITVEAAGKSAASVDPSTTSTALLRIASAN